MTRPIRLLLVMVLLFSSGFNVLAEAGNKIEKYSWLLLLNKPNQAPVIDPEVGRNITWPTNSVQLDATVDSPSDNLVYEWKQLSGLGIVTFSNHSTEDTTATFPVYGETYVLQLSVSDGGLISTIQVTVAFNFLANYTNAQQQELPVDGIYPLGQRMPVSGYSSDDKHHYDANNHFDTYYHLELMKNAKFSMDGPLYAGEDGPPSHYWQKAEEFGMKGWFRLYIHNYNGSSHWGAVIPQMKTTEGRENIRRQIGSMINRVQNDPARNNHVVAWYGYPEEPIDRNSTAIDEQRAYLQLVHNTIKATDKKKRPYYVIERGDSKLENMIGNSCYQDGSMKQNYLIRSNAYEGDTEMRYRMHHWARDQIITAEIADSDCPSYTGKKRAAISVLAMFRDPDDTTERNEEWLRKAITHDIYTQLAAGIDGFALYTWADSSIWSQTTKTLQENIYLEILGQFARAGLGTVFLWGDDRDDISMEIMQGPKTIIWQTLSKPSIQMRNIQYGDNRYILLVNSSKEVIKPKLSGFPNGLRILDIIPGNWYDLGSSITPTIHPLGVRMYMIEQK